MWQISRQNDASAELPTDVQGPNLNPIFNSVRSSTIAAGDITAQTLTGSVLAPFVGTEPNRYSQGDLVCADLGPEFRSFIESTYSSVKRIEYNDRVGLYAIIGENIGQLKDFNGVELISPSPVDRTVFIGVVNRSGEQVWFKYGFQNGTELNSSYTTVDVKWGSDNSLYLLGTVGGRIGSPPQPLDFEGSTIAGLFGDNSNGYLAKFDIEGNQLYFQTKSNSIEYPFLLRNEGGSDFLYLSSPNRSSTSTNFDGSLATVGRNVLTKLDESGAVVWTIDQGTLTRTDDYVGLFELNDEIVVVEEFNSTTARLAYDGVTPIARGTTVARISTAGVMLEIVESALRTDYAVASPDAVYISGRFDPTAGINDFAGMPLPTPISPTDDTNTFVAKFGTGTTFAEWLRVLQGTENESTGISAANEGVYVTGYISSVDDPVDFEGNPIPYANDNEFEAYVAKLSPSGDQEWFKNTKIEGEEGTEIRQNSSSTLAEYNDGVIVYTYFETAGGPIEDYEGNVATVLNGSGNYSTLAKFDSAGNQEWFYIFKSISSDEPSFQIVNTNIDSAFILFDEPSLGDDISFIDVNGQEYFSTSIQDNLLLEIDSLRVLIGVAYSATTNMSTNLITNGKVPNDTLVGLLPNRPYYFDSRSCQLTTDVIGEVYGITDNEGSLFIV